MGDLLDAGKLEGVVRDFRPDAVMHFAVLEVIAAAKKATDVDFPVRYEGWRPDDTPVLVAGVRKIRERLGWVPAYDDLERIIYSAWQWEVKEVEITY